MGSGGLCAMIPGTQQTQMLHVDSLDTLVLPVLPAIAQAVMQGEMVNCMIYKEKYMLLAVSKSPYAAIRDSSYVFYV